MSSIGLGIAGAGLAYGIFSGERSNAKANAIQKGLKTPVDEIPAEFYQNREIARQMAQIGLPTQVTNDATNRINQNQAAGIAAAQNSNNPGGNIAAIVRQGNQAEAKLAAEDAQARDSNQRYFIQQNATLGARKDQQEQANVFDPYTRDFNLMQAYRGAANTTANNTVTAGLSAGMAYFNNKTPGAGKNPDNYNVDANGNILWNSPKSTASGYPVAANMAIPTQYQGMPGLGTAAPTPTPKPTQGVIYDPVTGIPYFQGAGGAI